VQSSQQLVLQRFIADSGGSDKFGRQLVSMFIPTAHEVLQRQSLMSLMTISTRTDTIAAATTHGPLDN